MEDFATLALAVLAVFGIARFCLWVGKLAD